jgi:hypothetical protein
VIRSRALLLSALPLLAGCGLFGPHVPDAVVPGLVLVDHSEPAFTVFTAVPERLSATEMQELEAQTEFHPGVQLLPWPVFAERRDQIFDAVIAQDDYPGSGVRAGLVELLERYHGTPFGLTWNGGIAFTFQDYQYAKKTHELYVADPSALGRSSAYMPDQDPLVPALHFGPLLGWK